MATVSAPPTPVKIGPGDAGRRMTLEEFVAADWAGGWLYELARGVVVVTQVLGIHHGRIVERISERFVIYKLAHPGVINYRSAGSDCRIRLPGMQSDRHPDQAIYLTPPPKGKRIWYRWVPAIVVEVVSRRGEERDYVEKREEYLRSGVLEYWIFDPIRRKLVVQTREGDTWAERELGDSAEYRTELLPGLVVSVGEILGPAGEEEIDEVEVPGDDDLAPAG